MCLIRPAITTSNEYFLYFSDIFNSWVICLSVPFLSASFRQCDLREKNNKTYLRWNTIHCKYFIKAQPETCNFIKEETLAQVFSCEFCEISKNNFFTEHLWTTVPGSSIEPWGTPALTSDQSGTCPFNKTLCFLLLRKSHTRFSKLPDIPFCFNFKTRPLCQTLSNTFDISRKTPLTSHPSSNDSNIIWAIA